MSKRYEADYPITRAQACMITAICGFFVGIVVCAAIMHVFELAPSRMPGPTAVLFAICLLMFQIFLMRARKRAHKSESDRDSP